MANIRENKKNGKIISYRFTACLERDAQGKQVRKYTTWVPPEELTPAKAKKAAERAAESWEETAKAEYQQEKCATEQEQTPAIPAEKRHDDFSSFVNDTWIPLQVKNGSNKPCTVVFYQNNANFIVEHFKGKTLQSITPMDIEKYLVYLRTEYKSKLGKPLSPKTTHHMYATLNLIFGYAERQEMIVKNPHEIFNRVIAGDTFGVISRDLNRRGIPGALGGKWCVQRIRDIAGNEKHTGNAMLQKTYRNNHLEKKKCTNTGELPMFYAQDTHPAIIDKDTFKAAQAVLQRLHEAAEDKPRPQKGEFTGKIHCPFCGKSYKRNTSNGSVGWNCSTYLEQGKAYCHRKKIPETKLRVICAEVLEIGDYDAAVFGTQIDRIEVPEDNQLRFVFKDGSVIERMWADRSRWESWTTEMRQAAAERTLQRRKTQCQE